MNEEWDQLKLIDPIYEDILNNLSYTKAKEPNGENKLSNYENSIISTGDPIPYSIYKSRILMLKSTIPNIYYTELSKNDDYYSQFHNIIVALTKSKGNYNSLLFFPDKSDLIFLETDDINSLPRSITRRFSEFSFEKFLQNFTFYSSNLFPNNQQIQQYEEYYNVLMKEKNIKKDLNFLNFSYYQYGNICRLNYYPYFMDPCQVLDVDLDRKIAMVRLFPRIKTTMHDKSIIYSEPFPFQYKDFPEENRAKIKINLDKNAINQLNGIKINDSKYINEFLILKVPIRSLYCFSKFSLDDFSLFLHPLKDNDYESDLIPSRALLLQPPTYDISIERNNEKINADEELIESSFYMRSYEYSSDNEQDITTNSSIPKFPSHNDKKEEDAKTSKQKSKQKKKNQKSSDNNILATESIKSTEKIQEVLKESPKGKLVQSIEDPLPTISKAISNTDENTNNGNQNIKNQNVIIEQNDVEDSNHINASSSEISNNSSTGSLKFVKLKMPRICNGRNSRNDDPDATLTNQVTTNQIVFDYSKILTKTPKTVKTNAEILSEFNLSLDKTQEKKNHKKMLHAKKQQEKIAEEKRFNEREKLRKQKELEEEEKKKSINSENMNDQKELIQVDLSKTIDSTNQTSLNPINFNTSKNEPIVNEKNKPIRHHSTSKTGKKEKTKKDSNVEKANELTKTTNQTEEEKKLEDIKKQIESDELIARFLAEEEDENEDEAEYEPNEEEESEIEIIQQPIKKNQRKAFSSSQPLHHSLRDQKPKEFPKHSQKQRIPIDVITLEDDDDENEAETPTNAQNGNDNKDSSETALSTEVPHTQKPQERHHKSSHDKIKIYPKRFQNEIEDKMKTFFSSKLDDMKNQLINYFSHDKKEDTSLNKAHYFIPGDCVYLHEDKERKIPYQVLNQDGHTVTVLPYQKPFTCNISELHSSTYQPKDSTFSYAELDLVRINGSIFCIKTVSEYNIECISTDNEFKSFGLNTFAISIDDDNSVNDLNGRRVFVGDIVEIKKGRFIGSIGKVIHTFQGRLFISLIIDYPSSNSTKEFEAFLYKSQNSLICMNGRNILLLKDGYGNVNTTTGNIYDSQSMEANVDSFDHIECSGPALAADDFWIRENAIVYIKKDKSIAMIEKIKGNNVFLRKIEGKLVDNTEILSNEVIRLKVSDVEKAPITIGSLVLLNDLYPMKGIVTNISDSGYIVSCKDENGNNTNINTSLDQVIRIFDLNYFVN